LIYELILFLSRQTESVKIGLISKHGVDKYVLVAGIGRLINLWISFKISIRNNYFNPSSRKFIK